MGGVQVHKLEAAERLFSEAGNAAAAKEARRAKDQAQQKVRHSIAAAFTCVMLPWRQGDHGHISTEPASQEEENAT
jgi:hypothetical protein